MSTFLASIPSGLTNALSMQASLFVSSKVLAFRKGAVTACYAGKFFHDDTNLQCKDTKLNPLCGYESMHCTRIKTVQVLRYAGER